MTLQLRGRPFGPIAFALACLVWLTACAPSDHASRLDPEITRMYSTVQDGEFLIPAVPERYLNEETVRRVVDYWTDEPPGTIVVDPYAHRLYLVLEGNQALRYTVAVGEAGRNFAGNATIPVKREWPTWTPTANMLRRDPELNGPWRGGMQGGLQNPLGARALYLYRGGRDTLYRIHGTPYPQSVGRSVSSGCIRLFQQDILHLYEQVDTGTRVVVLSRAESEAPADVPVTGPTTESPFTVSYNE